MLDLSLCSLKELEDEILSRCEQGIIIRRTKNADDGNLLDYAPKGLVYEVLGLMQETILMLWDDHRDEIRE